MPETTTRRRRVSHTVLGGFGALGLVLLPAASATAEGIRFTTTSATVEYGEYWTFAVEPLDIGLYPGYTTATASVTGAPGWTPRAYIYGGSGAGLGEIGVYGSADQRPLDAGTYSVNVLVSFHNTPSYDTTNAPASLIITAAPLKIDAIIESDPVDPANAIVTARFTGRFVDEFLPPAIDPSIALGPAGTWKLSIVDADGVVVEQRDASRSATDASLATSFRWAGGEAGEEYTVQASFESDAATAKNFSITAGTFTYTTMPDARPVPVSSAEAIAPADVPEESDFSVPIWWLILLGVVIAGLVALTIVFAVRLVRSTPSSSAGTAKEAAHV